MMVEYYVGEIQMEQSAESSVSRSFYIDLGCDGWAWSIELDLTLHCSGDARLRILSYRTLYFLH